MLASDNLTYWRGGAGDAAHEKLLPDTFGILILNRIGILAARGNLAWRWTG
jgi:hypothetical protein